MALFPVTSTPCPYPIPSLNRRTCPGYLAFWVGYFSLSSNASGGGEDTDDSPLLCRLPSLLLKQAGHPVSSLDSWSTSNRCWCISSLDSSTRFSLHPSVWVSWEGRGHPWCSSRLKAERKPGRARRRCPRLWAKCLAGWL